MNLPNWIKIPALAGATLMAADNVEAANTDSTGIPKGKKETSESYSLSGSWVEGGKLYGPSLSEPNNSETEVSTASPEPVLADSLETKIEVETPVATPDTTKIKTQETVCIPEDSNESILPGYIRILNGEKEVYRRFLFAADEFGHGMTTAPVEIGQTIQVDSLSYNGPVENAELGAYLKLTRRDANGKIAKSTDGNTVMLKKVDGDTFEIDTDSLDMSGFRKDVAYEVELYPFAKDQNGNYLESFPVPLDIKLVAEDDTLKVAETYEPPKLEVVNGPKEKLTPRKKEEQDEDLETKASKPWTVDLRLSHRTVVEGSETNESYSTTTYGDSTLTRSSNSSEHEVGVANEAHLGIRAKNPNAFVDVEVGGSRTRLHGDRSDYLVKTKEGEASVIYKMDNGVTVIGNGEVILVSNEKNLINPVNPNQPSQTEKEYDTWNFSAGAGYTFGDMDEDHLTIAGMYSERNGIRANSEGKGVFVQGSKNIGNANLHINGFAYEGNGEGTDDDAVPYEEAAMRVAAEFGIPVKKFNVAIGGAYNNRTLDSKIGSGSTTIDSSNSESESWDAGVTVSTSWDNLRSFLSKKR